LIWVSDTLILLFFLQFLLPLCLIGWIALAPPRSRLAFYMQGLGSAAGLLAMGLTGLWLFPPWWTPWVFAVLLVMAVLWSWWRRNPFASWWPKGWTAWIFMAAFIVVGGWGAYQSAGALAGRAPQTGALVDLAFPLKDGTYLVVNGGSNIRVNPHLMTLDASMARFHAYRGQSYGVDIVKLDEWGFRARGLQPSDPAAYVIYGTPVYAPCSGVVRVAMDGLPDMRVPQMDREHMAGNYVLLRCKDADVLLGHLKPGSLKVRVGDQITAGQPIGAVGNTGNTGEPHLHIHAQQAGTALEPISGNPLPIRLNGRYLVRNDRVSVP
jgi:Peptidase family M23